MSADTDKNHVEKALLALGEHFDCVQIFATRYDTEGDGEERGTRHVAMGSGNWFARYGHIRSWIIEEDARSRADACHDEEDED
jgi:hypothetical protein